MNWALGQQFENAVKSYGLEISSINQQEGNPYVSLNISTPYQKPMIDDDSVSDHVRLAIRETAKQNQYKMQGFNESPSGYHITLFHQPAQVATSPDMGLINPDAGLIP